MKKKTTLLMLLFSLCAGFWLVSTSRAATESPEYRVVRSEGGFELRDYPELTLATSVMAADGVNGGFGQLFRFITGANERKEKIEMTAPVLIANTTEQKRMSFIMPKAAVSKGVPNPAGKDVALDKMAAARYAVLRFPGGRNAENEAKALASLREWIAAQKLTAAGEPLFAYYDPPWTLIPFRRNEVMLKISPQP